MTTIVGSIVGKALDGLANLQKGADSTGAQSATHGPGTPTAPHIPGGGPEHHDGGWQQHGPDGVHGPPTGGPSPTEGMPGGMQTGGPAPQGMQDVFPNIAQQLASSLSSVVDGLGSLTRTTLAAPVQVPGVPMAAQAAASALAQSGAVPAATNAQAAAQQAILGAAAPNTVAIATPATVVATAAASQAATPNAVANPAAPTLAQPTSTVPGTVSDTSALMQNRAAETLPPRLDNASLLSRMASALPPGSTTSSNATPPTTPPGLTQGMTAAGLTMATAAVNQPVDARGAILAANDSAAIRADNALTLAGHTLDGLQRRSMRNRVQLLPQRMTRLLWALGLMGTQASEHEPDPERELQRAMQWLFWMLAVIAYGCLAVAIVALVGSNSHMFDYEASRSYTGWLALFGLLTGTVAWLLARRMSRR